jgi:hypothetical protein
MSENPYAYRPDPIINIEPAERDKLSQSIRSFVDGEIPDDDEFDEIEWLSLSSKDPVVCHVAEQFCVYLEENGPRTRLEWGHLQRLLLLCESRHTLSVEKRDDWGPSQPLAGVGFLVMLGLLLTTGFTPQLWLFSIALNCVCVTMAIRRQLTVQMFEPRPLEKALAPFSSIHDLAVVYREVNFRKHRFKGAAKPASDGFSWFKALPTILVCSIAPILPLMIAVFPHSEKRATVVLNPV